MCRYVDAVDNLDTRDFDAVLIDGRCSAASMRCSIDAVLKCQLPRIILHPAPAPRCKLKPPLVACIVSPPSALALAELACLLFRFRVACGLKVLPYLTDGSVVMVHDWEQR